MRDGSRSKRTRGLLWGLFLIALGGVFLCDKFGIVEVGSLWHFWPAFLVILGVSHLFEGKPGSAATFTLLGLSFFAAEFRWWGLAYHNFWPLLVIAIGVGIVIGALSGEDERRKDREEASHDRA